MSGLRTGFLGSGHFAARCLTLLAEKTRPDWVVTNAPRPAGRGLKLLPSPVQEVCQALDIPFRTTERISKDEACVEWIAANTPDALLVIDFGHLLKEPLLSMASLGCLNVHPSLLPKYRGAAPVQRAILEGEKTSGVTIFRLTEGMDSGPILALQEIKIEDTDNSASFFEKSAIVGTNLLCKYLLEIPASEWSFKEQNDAEATTASKINKAEAEIDWRTPASGIFNKVRAFNPSPVAYTTVGGKRLRLLESKPVSANGAPGTVIDVQNGLPVVACGDGALLLLSVQPEGKKAQSAADWYRGSRLFVGGMLE